MLITLYMQGNLTNANTRRLYLQEVEKLQGTGGEYIIQAHYHNGSRDRFIFSAKEEALRFYQIMKHGRRYFRDRITVFVDHCEAKRKGTEKVLFVTVKGYLGPPTESPEE